MPAVVAVLDYGRNSEAPQQPYAIGVHGKMQANSLGETGRKHNGLP